MNQNVTKVLIVDDSPTAIQSLEFIFSQDDRFQVAGTFTDPIEALEHLPEVKADIIIVDIVMPKMNGFDFVDTVTKKYGIPAIVVSSIYSEEDKYKTMKAFDVGALAIMEKPIGQTEKAKALTKQLLSTIQKVVEEKHVAKPKTPEKQAPKECEYKIIGIGTSLGGPAALKTLLKTLPENLTVPIVIVQHIGEGFDHGLVKWLAQ